MKGDDSDSSFSIDPEEYKKLYDKLLKKQEDR